MVSSRFRKFLVAGFLFAAMACATVQGAHAGTEKDPQGKSPAAEEKNKVDPRKVLHKGAMLLGLTAGAGAGAAVLGSNERHDLALAYLHYGYVVSDPVAPEKWYGGALEFSCEPFGGIQYHPTDARVVGVMLGLRYNFLTRSAWVPFVEGGVGPSLTDIGKPDLSTGFQFNTQLGVGTHYLLKESLALTLQLRGIHLSNAYIKRPNFGSNTLLLLGGISWFF